MDSAELELQKAETKKTEGLRKKKELEGLIALVKEFQGAYNATKEQQEKYKISIEKYKSREKFTRNCFRVSGRAGRAPGAGTERGLPMPGMWFFRASASGNTSQRTGCGSGNPGQRETKLDRLENDANTQSVEAGKRKERQKTLWHQIQREAQELYMRRNGKADPFAERKTGPM